MPNWRAGAGGAASGAAIGTTILPGWGTAIGGVAGGLLGLFAGGGGGSPSSGAANAQRASLDQAMQRLQQGSAEQYAQRMKDLKATMEFYGPAERYLQSIYGGPATGPQPLAKGPPGMGQAQGPPPGFPKPQGPVTPLTYGQPRKGGLG